ncbi:hypothetical protein HUO09_17025 [Vibrio sp. Y2-5]|uniref:hypothetical protein n=1 Tax=Vibrio sp. Y2-5 TaxID=2743977 RepID=UPI00166148D8|nr:hypothetical protein [Vibrio sp. Y2-5]MBD0788059.1 hypothetical protein [Vibrio sp. Y2-5]
MTPLSGYAIQSVRIKDGNDTATQISRTKRALRNSHKAEYDVFIKRDGHLIRYSASQPVDCYIESIIGGLRNTERAEVADGSFFYLTIVGGQYVCTDIEGWIPKEEVVLTKDDLVQYIQRGYVIFTSSNELKQVQVDEEQLLASIKKLQLVCDDYETNQEQLGELEAIEKQEYEVSKKRLVDEKQKVISTKLKTDVTLSNLQPVHISGTELTRKQIVGIFIVVGLIVLIGSAYFYFKQSNHNATFELPLKKVSETVDTYESFRQTQSGRTTLGKVLHYLEPTYLTVRNNRMPDNWVNKEIFFTDGSLTGTIITEGNRIGKIGDLVMAFNKSPNKQFIRIDGQDVSINVPVASDGEGLTNQKFNFTKLRDNSLDLLALLGAREIRSNKKVNKGNYTTQEITASFTQVPVTYIGRLARLMGNQPIYVETLKLTQTAVIGKVSIDFTATVIGFNDTNANEASHAATK